MVDSDISLVPGLGVGVVYFSGLEALLEADPALIDVLEIEPQTTWIESLTEPGAIQSRRDVEEYIAALPGRKLVHSIGTPVGGSTPAIEAQLPLLQNTVKKLQAPFASEHLAFNLTSDAFTGFFLPPRQTAEGITVYTQAITALRRALGVPLAIETGVNYLRPRSDEIPDGEFLTELVRSADCGILLDLHNIYCNQLNGRQTMEQFFSQIPLDRVWEVHLAGGFELNGFWLDAHSGAIPDPLLSIAREIIPHLPNLKAIIFEIFPSFLPVFGLDGVKEQVDKLRSLWQLRRLAASPQTACIPARSAVLNSGPSVQEWEQSLGGVVIGRPGATALDDVLAKDPGVALVRELIEQFRASMVVGVYRLTSRLLMLALTPDVFFAILKDYWSRHPPRQYAASEAEAFFSDLESRNLRIPWFSKVWEFERAALLTILDSQPRLVRFSADPFPILNALADGRLPDVIPQEGDYEIELTPEGPLAISGIEMKEQPTTFPFH
jgi:uncharacterized protein (UPF0276 family)